MRRKVLQRNRSGVICKLCPWKPNLNKGSAHKTILLNFIFNSSQFEIHSHVFCRHSYSRFYCASRGARGSSAARTSGGDCGGHTTVMERGSRQPRRSTNWNRIGGGEIASGAIYGGGNSAPFAGAGKGGARSFAGSGVVGFSAGGR